MWETGTRTLKTRWFVEPVRKKCGVATYFYFYKKWKKKNNKWIILHCNIGVNFTIDKKNYKALP